MRMQQALNLIAGKPAGFRVSYDDFDGRSALTGPCFPGDDEPLIPTEAMAWALAHEFAAKAPENFRNIYVVDSHYKPVPGYQDKRLRPYEKAPAGEKPKEQEMTIKQLIQTLQNWPDQDALVQMYYDSAAREGVTAVSIGENNAAVLIGDCP